MSLVALDTHSSRTPSQNLLSNSGEQLTSLPFRSSFSFASVTAIHCLLFLNLCGKVAQEQSSVHIVWLPKGIMPNGPCLVPFPAIPALLTEGSWKVPSVCVFLVFFRNCCGTYIYTLYRHCIVYGTLYNSTMLWLVARTVGLDSAMAARRLPLHWCIITDDGRLHDRLSCRAVWQRVWQAGMLGYIPAWLGWQRMLADER